jgi:hypothetical protein
MLTRAKHKQGEGTLKTFNPEVGLVYPKGRRWQKRTSMMNNRKTFTWSFIACQKWLNEGMEITRRG